MNKFFSILFFLGLFCGSAFAQKLPDNLCVSNDEIELFKLINEMRKENGLPAVKLSASLTYVAQTHVRDLDLTYIRNSNCNMHSWSEKGHWTPFCYPKDQSKKKSVWDKPKELTNYPGQAYEVVFWENGPAIPKNIIESWKSTSQSELLINGKGKWDKMNWKVVGIGIYNGYCSAWFGESEDNLPIRICNSDSLISSSNTTTGTHQTASKSNTSSKDEVSAAVKGRFYIIYGSFNTLVQAKAGLSDLLKQGLTTATIIQNDGKFRISLNDFGSFDEAKAARKTLTQKYPDAWILRM